MKEQNNLEVSHKTTPDSLLREDLESQIVAWVAETAEVVKESEITLATVDQTNCKYISYLVAKLRKDGLSISILKRGTKEAQDLALILEKGYKIYMENALRQLREGTREGERKIFNSPASGVTMIRDMAEDTMYNLSDIGTSEEELESFIEK